MEPWTLSSISCLLFYIIKQGQRHTVFAFIRMYCKGNRFKSCRHLKKCIQWYVLKLETTKYTTLLYPSIWRHNKINKFKCDGEYLYQMAPLQIAEAILEWKDGVVVYVIELGLRRCPITGTTTPPSIIITVNANRKGTTWYFFNTLDDWI